MKLVNKLMSSNIVLIYSIGLSIFLFSFVETKSNYVVCDDGISACSDGMQCCKRGTGYRCCPSNLCCCEEGNYCCSCGNLRIELFEGYQQSLPSFYQYNIAEKNSTEINAIFGGIELVDSFLNITGYYKYSRNALGCRDELRIILKDIRKELEIFDSQIKDKAQLISQLSSGLAEVLFHLRQFILDCQHVSSEFNTIIKQISSNVMDYNYILKVFSQIETNLTEILKIISDINSDCSMLLYPVCGRSLGRLFKLILEV